MPLQDPEGTRETLLYLRHLSTLSTGAIILQIGFMENLFRSPKWIGLIVTSLVSFTISTVACVAGQNVVLHKGTGWTAKEQESGLVWLIIIYLTFAVGLLSLLIFTLKNLLCR
jgi:hypothetical protein